MRFSSYTIVSDRLRGGGYALMNGISGAVDLVPDDLGEALRAASDTSRPTAAWLFDHERAAALIPDLPRETIDEFLARGHLTETSPDDERMIVANVARTVHDVQTECPQFMIVPNLDCNYRCTYCFERPLQNKLKVADSAINHYKSNVVMTVPQVGDVFASIRSIQDGVGKPSGGQIVLYGGEPLDAAHYDVVRHIVTTGAAAGFVFSAITNGHNLDRYLDLLGQERIAQVQISVDGPKEVHDRRRVFIGGTSSFDAVVANVRRALAATTVDVQLRVHVDPSNIHLFEEVMSLFEHEGWLDRDQVTIYANTVYEKTVNGVVNSRIENGRINEQLRAIARRHRNVYTSAPAVHATRALSPVFGEGDRFQVKGTYCAANTGNYIFAPDGHIYACWESVGKACSRIGTYGGVGVVFDEAAVRKWFGRSVASIPECLTCSYALVCGGGCAQYSEYNYGDPFKPYCDDFQQVFSGVLAEEVESFLQAQVPEAVSSVVHSTEGS